MQYKSLEVVVVVPLKRKVTYYYVAKILGGGEGNWPLGRISQGFWYETLISVVSFGRGTGMGVS